MDEKKRAEAHGKYERAAPRQRASRLSTAPLPKPARPDTARRRAADREYEKAVAVDQAGEDRINKLLADEGLKPKQRARFFPMDAFFFTAVMALLCFGLVMMYSAGYAWSQYLYGSGSYLIKRQAFFAVVGVGVMIAFACYDYNRLKKWVFPIWIVTIGLLVAVLLVGKAANGAKRWLEIPGVTSIQPSEIAKFTVVLLMAWFTDRAGSRMKSIKNFRWSVLPILFTLASIVPLVMLEHHLSATVIITVTAFVMLFNSDINMTYIAGFAGLGAAGVFAAVKLNLFADYAAARIPIWKDPFSDPRGLGYQTIQSLYAIASGGIFGLGLGKSRQKQLYLPEAHNDYVFAIVCEELGMVGALAVILLFAVLIIRGFWIAMHARDRFGAMLVVGIMTNVALQTVLNIAVVTNTIPVTGISLPFFSYGGSSLVMLLAEMGIVLSVSKQMHVERNG